MKAAFDPRFSRQGGWPRVAIVVSIAVHVLLFLGPVESRLPVFSNPPDRVISLVPAPPDENEDSPLIYVTPPRRETNRPPRPGESRASAPSLPAPAEPAIITPLTPRLERPPIDTGPAAPRARGYARVAPDYGNGVLWVRPVPISPEVIARRLEAEHFEHVDSAVTAIMQAFLDSLATEPGSGQVRMPEWTTNVAGSKFGLDSKYIYIAGLKIPAAVLALLPLPQGNIDQARAYNHLMDLRADIERAARRADNMEEFKRVISEIRDRKQRERDFQRAQRETPPPPPPPNDPPTP
jgi:hypothetical protein